ncbi:hypothetical protein [Halalkalibacter sp. APA_J-10(15)]|uniref:hypothetical protein n=1 Tax=Halalkalibacter sp. APA_J-10(15) TaxID=2933805 RepID=UPI001FF3A9A3|nr:hypothetical protein [Halalkalibacter sp. APA_J-10(15)]MCK0472934.1 hypothetical protein [Halalkalibacter sp. APA_J-10(15)]
MKLKIYDETYQYHNEISVLEDVFKKINDMIEQSDEFFSHLEVDQAEVYENHDAYLVEHIASVKEITVVMKTKKEILIETIQTTEVYLTGALPEVEALSEAFYQNPTEQTWDTFGQLVEGMNWLIQLVQSIKQIDLEVPYMEQYVESLTTMESELPTLLEAVENKDAILIADIINYEVLPAWKQLKSTATKTIDEIGTRPEAN